jgi:primosomal protein N' (replication factor Y)
MNLNQSKIIKVAINVPVDDLFDYQCQFPVGIGQYVVVQFGSRQMVGIVVEVGVKTKLDVKKIKNVIRVDNESLFDEELFKLFRFVSSYYQYPIGQTIHTALPSKLKKDENQKKKPNYIYEPTSKLTVFEIDNFSKRQKNLIKIASLILENNIEDSEINHIVKNGKKYLNVLEENGYVSKNIKKNSKKNSYEELIQLNSEQEHVIEKIRSSEAYTAFLIHGITGSGKTEVYMQLIQHYLKNQGQVLILVPEINLTPQLESRFKKRFHNYEIVSLHSHLSNVDRLHNWRLAKSGEADIVIGTRLSILTPFKNLKAIFIDEEHDLSFKQQDNLRYHARDVAMIRAKNLKIPLVMGSATPSIEMWNLSKTKKLTLLCLSKRAIKSSVLPAIKFIPLNSKVLDTPISSYLMDAISARLKQQQQSLIFINRRGFSPVLFCSSCGWKADCNRCSTTLVVHRERSKLKCHHCDLQVNIYKSCENCGNLDLMTLGSGTQKIEEFLRKSFPQANICRVDRDSMKSKKNLDQLYKDVHANKIDILVGTQMLAKGHDFPNLTLVGVLDADHSLYSSDFKASERLFAQLIQVAGRAGRANIKGEAIIETLFPNHPIYESIGMQDFQSFADQVLQERQDLQLPPFINQAVLRAESKNKEYLRDFMEFCYKNAQALKYNIDIFQPARPYLERLNNYERAHIFIHAMDRLELNKFLINLRTIIYSYKKNYRIKWFIDVDPVAL